MQGARTIEQSLDQKRNLSLKLTVIARQLRNRFNQNVSQMGFTRSQWALIAVVARNPGTTQRTIAEALEISEAAAGRLIDRLCADGFLERQARDDDRRAYSVHLTEAVQPHLAVLGEVARRNEEEAFAGLSEAELDQLSDLLGRVYNNISPQK